MLRDLALLDASWKVVLLRYFNSVRTHENALIGEDANDISSNLMPFVSQRAVRCHPHLIRCDDASYPAMECTRRDYTHVSELTKAHVATLPELNRRKGSLSPSRSILEQTQLLDVVNGTSKKPPVAVLRRSGLKIDGLQYRNMLVPPSSAENLPGWKAQRDEGCGETYGGGRSESLGALLRC